MTRKNKTVAIAITIGVIALVAVIIATVNGGETELQRKITETPEGNFTILSWNEDFLGSGVDIIAFHDDDRNITYLAYNGCTEAAMWGCPDYMLTPSQMSNNCNCS